MNIFLFLRRILFEAPNIFLDSLSRFLEKMQNFPRYLWEGVKKNDYFLVIFSY